MWPRKEKKNNPQNSGHFVPAATPKGSTRNSLRPKYTDFEVQSILKVINIKFRKITNYCSFVSSNQAFEPYSNSLNRILSLNIKVYLLPTIFHIPLMHICTLICKFAINVKHQSIPIANLFHLPKTLPWPWAMLAEGIYKDKLDKTGATFVFISASLCNLGVQKVGNAGTAGTSNTGQTRFG